MRTGFALLWSPMAHTAAALVSLEPPPAAAPSTDRIRISLAPPADAPAPLADGAAPSAPGSASADPVRYVERLRRHLQAHAPSMPGHGRVLLSGRIDGDGRLLDVELLQREGRVDAETLRRWLRILPPAAPPPRPMRVRIPLVVAAEAASSGRVP